MKKLMVILFVLALAGNALAQQAYFDDFESGYTSGVNIDTHVDWSHMDAIIGPSAMEAIDSGGFPYGDTAPHWSLQTTVSAYGIRRRLFGAPKTSGKWELRAKIQNTHWWNGATIGIYFNGHKDNPGTLNQVAFSLRSMSGYEGGYDYNIASVVNGGAQNEVQGGDGWTVWHDQWVEMRLTCDIETGVVEAHWRDLFPGIVDPAGTDPPPTPPDWEYLGTAADNFIGVDIEGTYFACTNGQAIFDDVQFNEIAGGGFRAADFDEDGDVDVFDFADWQTGFPTASGATHGDGDADSDGDVDGFDFAIWQADYPYPPPPAEPGPTPEPATLGLLLLGGLTILRRRR